MGDNLTINGATTISLVANTKSVSSNAGVTTILQINPGDRTIFDGLINQTANFVLEDTQERHEFSGKVTRIQVNTVTNSSIEVEVQGGFYKTSRR